MSEDLSKDVGLLQKHRVCLGRRKESEVEQGGAESEESVEQQRESDRQLDSSLLPGLRQYAGS